MTGGVSDWFINNETDSGFMEFNNTGYIDSLRTERGWSVSGLALEANLSENTLKHLYKRKTYPTLQTLYRISAALGYPLWQLLAFDNKAYTLSAQERELLNAYNRLSPRHRELLLHIANKI